jgi:hypothetical protein
MASSRYDLRPRPARRGNAPGAAGPSTFNDSDMQLWKLERIRADHPKGVYRKIPQNPYCWCGRRANHKRSGKGKKVRMCAVCFDRAELTNDHQRSDGTVDETQPNAHPPPERVRWVPAGYEHL